MLVRHKKLLYWIKLLNKVRLIFYVKPKKFKAKYEIKLMGKVGSAVKQQLLFSPTIPAEELVKRLEHQGINTTKGEIGHVRHILRKKGLITIGKYAKLNTKAAKIRNALYCGKGKKTCEEIAKETGSLVEDVWSIASIMKKEGFYIDIKPKGWPFRYIPILNAEQEKILIKSKNLVAQAVYKNSKKYNFLLETIKDFNAHVQRWLPGWIVSFSEYKGKKKYSLEYWINFKVKKAAIDFIRNELKGALGLKHSEIRLIGSIRRLLKKRGVILEKFDINQQRNTLGEIVKEISKMKEYKSYKLNLEKAEELITAYELYKKQSRLVYERHDT